MVESKKHSDILNPPLRSTIETLIQASFHPARTIVLSFGFDEEIGGFNGAGPLAAHLEEIYGKNSFAMVVDEGCKSITSTTLLNFLSG